MTPRNTQVAVWVKEHEDKIDPRGPKYGAKLKQDI